MVHQGLSLSWILPSATAAALRMSASSSLSALPMAGMFELYERTRATRQMVILRRADHGHFADEFEQQPEHCTREQAHLYVRGLTVCHLEATLRELEGAHRLMASDVEAELAARGVEGIVCLAGSHNQYTR